MRLRDQYKDGLNLIDHLMNAISLLDNQDLIARREKDRIHARIARRLEAEDKAEEAARSAPALPIE